MARLMNLLAFIVGLCAALWHFCREHYYAAALNHVGHNHPDSWLITRRMLYSRTKVNDFMSKVTTR